MSAMRPHAFVPGLPELVIGTWSDLDARCPERLNPALRVQMSNSVHSDDFIIQEEDGRLILSGKNERATLYAVYQYAREVWGLHWVYPGSEPQMDEPSSGSRIVPGRLVRFCSPKLERRGFVVETVRDPEYLKQMIDWMAKNGANEIFFTFMLWDEYRDELAPEIAKRGLQLTLGGHSMTFFTNRSESLRAFLADHPYTAKKQFNYNDESWFPAFFNQMSDYCKGVPNLTRLSLWPEDVADPSGGDFLSPYIRFSEQLKAHLHAEGIRVEVEHIAYNAGLAWHMLEMGGARPSASVDTLFAYWGRDYRYGYVSTPHENEQRARRALEEWAGAVHGTKRKLTLFEYYSDHFMLSSLFPALPKRIAKDVEYYANLGVDGIVNLIVPYRGPDDYPWQWVHGFNSFVFSRALWGEPLEQILHDYALYYPEDKRGAVQALFEVIESTVTELTRWNVPLFPARAVDPDKAAATKEQAEAIIGTLQRIRSQLSPALASAEIDPQSNLYKYAARLIEYSVKLEEQWRTIKIGM